MPAAPGVVIAAFGGATFALGVGGFRSFAQVTGTETGGLITTGIYAWTRHPQYTGWIILFVGVSVAARSPLALLLTVAMVVAVRVWLPYEERHLVAEFGDDYRRYAQRVPRFLRLTPGRQRAS